MVRTIKTHRDLDVYQPCEIVGA